MKRKAAVALSLLTVLFAGALSGCDFAGLDLKGREPPPGTAARGRISIVVNNLGMTFPEGTDENNNPYLSFIKEKTGLDISAMMPPQEAYEDKLNLIMSSGNLPDVLHVYNPVWIDSYVRQNALLPLDDLIERLGPELKSRIPEEAWARVRYNGRIYAIPSLNEVRGIEIMYARKDWLDRLGLSAPVTLEDYYQVIRAFAQDDPDGNGKNDTVGLVLGEDLNRSAPFFGAFGTQLDSWLLRDGRLVFGSIVPETKEALSYLARLYGEKLLDQEFPLNRNSNLVQKVESGLVGLYSATWYDTRGPIAGSKARNPQAEWIPLEYPTGADGQKGVYDKDMIRGYNVIPAGASNPEGVIRYLNFLASEEGYKTLKLGFEDQIWRMEDGKLVTDFAQHDKHLYRGIYQSMLDVRDDKLNRMRLDSLGDFRLYDNLQTIQHNLIPNQFYGSPTPAMSKLNGQLPNLHEAYIRIIMGLEPLDAFDRYVEEWKEAGGVQITNEVNDWYIQKQREGQRGNRP